MPVKLMRILICTLCGCKCDEANPVTQQTMFTTGGFVQWAKYRNAIKAAGHKMPSGKVCALCNNLFRMLDLKLKFGSIKKYWKWQAAQQGRHQPFLDARKKLIRKINDDPSAYRIKDAKSLKSEMAEQLSAVEVGGQQWEDDWDFVEKSVFLKENPHASPAEYAFVTEEVKGQKLEGVWVRLGASGHHKMKRFSGKWAQKVKVLDDGQNVISQAQVKDKFQSMVTKQREESSKAEKGSISMARLLALSGMEHEPENDDADDASSDNSGADSDDDSEGSDFNFFSSKKEIKCPTKKLSSASTKSTTSSHKPGAGKAPSVTSSSPLSALPDDVASRVGSGRAAVAMDGRTERTKTAVALCIREKWPAFIEAIKLTGAYTNGDEEHAFKEAVRVKLGAAQLLLTELKLNKAKVQRSTGRTFMVDEDKQVSEMVEAVAAAVDALKIFTTVGMDDQQIVDTLDACDKNGCTLGEAFARKAIMAAVGAASRYGRYEDACLACVQGSTQVSGALYIGI